MNQWLKRAGVLSAAVARDVALWLLREYRDKTVDLAKIETARCYLLGVEHARRSFVWALLLACAAGIFAAGSLLLPVGLLVWLGPDQPEKIGLTLLLIGAVYIIGTIALFRWVSSQKRWMQLTRANEVVQRVLKNTEQ